MDDNRIAALEERFAALEAQVKAQDEKLTALPRQLPQDADFIAGVSQGFYERQKTLGL